MGPQLNSSNKCDIPSLPWCDCYINSGFTKVSCSRLFVLLFYYSVSSFSGSGDTWRTTRLERSRCSLIFFIELSVCLGTVEGLVG